MRRIAALGAALVLLLAAAPVASADPGKSDEARAEHQATTKFWTKERVRQAKPRDFVRVRGTDRFVPAKGANGTKNGKGNGRPKPTPPPTEPPPPGTIDVTGASWDSGGTVADVTGKVLFQLGVKTRGKNRGEPLFWVCSATAVEDGNPNRTLILTAAHCVYDNQINKYADKWMFIPDYDNGDTAPDLTGNGSFCADTKYGCWTSSALVVHSGFSSEPGFTTAAVLYDFAFAVVDEGGKGGNTLLEGAEGALPGPYPGLSYKSVGEGNSSIDTDDVFAFGYPQAFSSGTDLTYCKGDVTFDSRMSNGTYGLLGCEMTGGASGGGWYAGFDEGTGNGTLMSVNSYGYTGTEAMYGPKFNENTRAVFNMALEADVNVEVG